MIHLLAVLPDPSSSQSIGWLALAAFALIAGVNQVLRLTDRFRESPPAHTQYVSKADHAELKTRVDNMTKQITEGFERLDHKRSQSVAGLHDNLEKSITALRLETKADMTGLHDRMNDVLTAVSRLEGTLEK